MMFQVFGGIAFFFKLGYTVSDHGHFLIVVLIVYLKH